jgi:hypothetical protein
MLNLVVSFKIYNLYFQCHFLFPSGDVVTGRFSCSFHGNEQENDKFCVTMGGTTSCSEFLNLKTIVAYLSVFCSQIFDYAFI